MEGNIAFLLASIKSRKLVKISHHFKNRLDMIKAVENYLDEIGVKYDTFNEEDVTVIEKRRV